MTQKRTKSKMAADAGSGDSTGLLRLVADIRAAVGDPTGKLMQDELVAHCAELLDRVTRAEAILERDQAAQHAEALNDIADILQLPTGATTTDIVAACRRAPGSIYELVDATDDEIYQTLGLYLTRQEAIDDATGGGHPPTDCYGDVAIIEIRERKIGFGGYSDHGKKVGIARWENVYDEATDESAWNVEYKSNETSPLDATAGSPNVQMIGDMTVEQFQSRPLKRPAWSFSSEKERKAWIQKHLKENV